jgi:hypothetical protein
MAVPHEFEFSVGRDEADAVLRLELAELDALVELAVVNGYCTFPTAGSVATTLCFITL